MIGKGRFLVAALLAFGLSGGMARAEPAVGVSLSWVFGSGASSAALGLKVFSTRQRDKAAATIGVDYLFADGVLRPNLGVAWIGRRVFVGGDIGYNPQRGSVDFGLGFGGVNSRAPLAAPPAVGGGGGGGGNGEGNGIEPGPELEDNPA